MALFLRIFQERINAGKTNFICEPMTKAEEVITLATKEYLYSQDEKRKELHERLYHYYKGNEKQIKDYLSSALQITYSADRISQMQMNYVNFTQKLINQLCVVYKRPATRKLARLDNSGKYIEDEKATEYYKKISPIDQNTQDKTAHYYAKLFGSSFSQVLFDDEAGTIKFRVHPNHQLTIKCDEDDIEKIKLLMYDRQKENEGKPEIVTVVWTDENNFKLDENGNILDVDESNPNGLNPFEVIPFAKFILNHGEDIWGVGQNDVVNVNEQVNFLLTKLINDDVVLGTAGTVLATNLGLTKKGNVNDPDQSGVREVKIGVKNPITVENARSDGGLLPPDLKHVSFDPQIEAVKQTIDWYIKTIALSKGLNPNSFLADVQATSGYSKIIDSLEQLEVREGDIEACRIFEKERFNIVRKINNYYARTEIGKKFKLSEIDETLELLVDFSEIEIPKTQAEIWEDRKERLALNMASPVDFIIEENPDEDETSAQEILEKNKLINESMKPTQQDENQSILNQFLKQPGRAKQNAEA